MNKREFVSGAAVLASPLAWSLPATAQACPRPAAAMSLAHWRSCVGQHFDLGPRGDLRGLNLTAVREQTAPARQECFTLVFDGAADGGDPGLAELRSGDGTRYTLFLQRAAVAGRVVAPFQRLA